ncbi:MAG: glutathione S-transferase family protein [Alphaproteobacteria bacterium]|nr:glutathione S-transferase family protein [Alphaproteobacteria bacterium]
MRIIHGSPYARTNYVIWAMKELGLDFDVNPVNPMKGETRHPDYLALNPNGLIPTLEEGDLILWETMAINMYLAKTYGDGLLWATDPQQEAQIMQWLAFGHVNLDEPAVNYLLHLNILPEEMRSEAKLEEAKTDIVPLLEVLDGHLAGRNYLVDDRFTIADLSLAAILDYPRKAGYDLSKYSNISPWLTRCVERPIRVEMNKI